MVSNISKHASYIGATVGYVSDQIGEHPDILRSGQVRKDLYFNLDLTEACS